MTDRVLIEQLFRNVTSASTPNLSVTTIAIDVGNSRIVPSCHCTSVTVAARAQDDNLSNFVCGYLRNAFGNL